MGTARVFPSLILSSNPWTTMCSPYPTQSSPPQTSGTLFRTFKIETTASDK